MAISSTQEPTLSYIVISESSLRAASDPVRASPTEPATFSFEISPLLKGIRMSPAASHSPSTCSVMILAALITVSSSISCIKGVKEPIALIWAPGLSDEVRNTGFRDVVHVQTMSEPETHSSASVHTMILYGPFRSFFIFSAKASARPRLTSKRRSSLSPRTS